MKKEEREVGKSRLLSYDTPFFNYLINKPDGKNRIAFSSSRSIFGSIFSF